MTDSTMRNWNWTFVLVMACLIGSAAAPASATLLIDDYNLPPSAATLISSGLLDMRSDLLPSPVPYAHPVRDTSVLANPGGLVYATVGSGYLVSANVIGTGGTVGLLYYAGPARDYTAMGGSQLDLDFATISPFPFPIFLTATVNGASTTGPLPLPIAAATTISIPFGAFSIPGALSAVSTLDLTFTFTGGGSFFLNSVSVPMTGVPEPTAVSVWLLVGLCGMGFVRISQAWWR